MPIDKEKKKLYNKRYQEKLKTKKESQESSQTPIDISKLQLDLSPHSLQNDNQETTIYETSDSNKSTILSPPLMPVDTLQPPVETPEPPEECVTLDVETYLELLKCYKQHNIPAKQEEPPKSQTQTSSSSSDNFFFQTMKQTIVQQLAMTLPAIALKLAVDHGAKFYNSQSSNSTIQQSKQDSKQDSNIFQMPIRNLE